MNLQKIHKCDTIIGKSEALNLAESGLMTGWQSHRQAGKMYVGEAQSF